MARLKSLLCAMLLLPFAAGAATPVCWPDLSLPIQLNIVDKTQAPKVGEVIYVASSVGLVWGYTCIAPDGQWYAQIAAGAWDKFPADWLYQLDIAIRGTNADREALWNKYTTASAWDTRLQSDLDAVWAKLPRQPAPTEWKVLRDPFRPDGKRLVYNVTGGKRGTPTSQYVEADAPCDPSVTISEFGGTIFMSVLGNPALVARCVK
jgi:hypothetical protein